MMGALARRWWMVAIRAALGILFGLLMLWCPEPTLGVAVVLFGAYAVLDGTRAVAMAIGSSDRWLEGRPVGLEGLVSVALGTLALGWPLVSPGFIDVVVTWGMLTGALELLGATGLPREGNAHWLWAVGGVSSVFLAVLILTLPHADQTGPIRALGACALVFGAALGLLARRLRQLDREGRWCVEGRAARTAAGSRS
jgi:uncharacterized membrane protein HdeD (DUF308 family)